MLRHAALAHSLPKSDVKNALVATAGGWLASDAERLYRSTDGLTWEPWLEQGALTLLTSGADTWMGTDQGVQAVSLAAAVA